MRRSHVIVALVLLVLLAAAAVLSQAGYRQLPPAAPTATPVPLDPFSTGPGYDSGWRSIDAGQTIGMWHALAAPPALLLVHLQTRKSGVLGGIDQLFVGGNDLGAYPGSFGQAEDRVGAYWHNLTTNNISVTRMPEDTLLNAVRIRIWEMSDGADWSSGWTSINADQSLILNHNLGGAKDDYVVDVMFNDTAGSGLGVNQRAFGGRDLGSRNFFNENSRIGAYWHGLDTIRIYVYRQAEDEYADQLLVRIWKKERPTYDSGWYAINKNTAHTFAHNIGGSAEDYRVDMEFKGTGWIGVNQCYYGGNDIGANPAHNMSQLENNRVGAYWYGLDADSITVRRRAEDPCAEQIRIRIWNFWTPTQPYYDSNWKAANAGQIISLIQNVDTDPDSMLVDLQFKDSGMFSTGMHQRGLGGMQLTNGDRLGGHWIFPSGNILFAFRREEDAAAKYFRSRIWKMPKPAYDSAWYDISSAGGLVAFAHSLGGNPADYLVDLQFKDSLVIHQIGYGGYDVTRFDATLGDRLGCYWEGLDDNFILIRRQPEETSAKFVRVRIWTLARPAYDSGMVSPTSTTTALLHNLNKNPESFWINLVFNNLTPGTKELHQMYYGGAVLSSQAVAPHIPGDVVGAFWRHLTSTDVDVFRHSDDTWIDQFRLRIWVPKQMFYMPLVRK